MDIVFRDPLASADIVFDVRAVVEDGLQDVELGSGASRKTLADAITLALTSVISDATGEFMDERKLAIAMLAELRKKTGINPEALLA